MKDDTREFRFRGIPAKVHAAWKAAAAKAGVTMEVYLLEALKAKLKGSR